MRFWRMCRRRYAAEAARGEGARLYGGRWNSRGVAVVYASTSLALAAVETFVNLEPNLRPKDLVSIEGEIPDGLGIERVDAKLLPARWYETRDESLRRAGDDWIRTGRTAALLVPSAAIRGEWNVLLNPAHADFSRIKFGKPASPMIGTSWHVPSSRGIGTNSRVAAPVHVRRGRERCSAVPPNVLQAEAEDRRVASAARAGPHGPRLRQILNMRCALPSRMAWH
jgi:RES domain-containing protein